MMLSRTEAEELTAQGQLEQDRLIRDQLRTEEEEKINKARAEIPGILRSTEHLIRSAAKIAKREVLLTNLTFTCGVDYKNPFARTKLLLPYRELLSEFESLGYTVEFKYGSQPGRPEWFCVVLKW